MTTPNTNSPTPITDAREFLTGWQGNERHKVVKSAVARQLETKLQSALREVEELKRDKERLDWMDLFYRNPEWFTFAECDQIYKDKNNHGIRVAIDNGKARHDARNAMKEEK